MRDCTSTESCTKPNVLCAYPNCVLGESRNAGPKTPTYEEQSAEITRLKEQLARTERERDQATRDMGIEASYYIVQCSKKTGNAVIVGNKDVGPDLYAHLAGKVEG